jgi:hypothetical protein
MHQQLWGYPSDHPNHTYLYSKQREIINSVVTNNKTVVVAANKTGKDFVASYICLWYFLHPEVTRIVTTSVKDSHLDVLWDEIGGWISRCKYPLRAEDGGPLYCTDRKIRKVVNGQMCDHSYIRGMVSAKPEGLAGHHAPRTLFVVDEASGSEDVVFDMGESWAAKQLYVGNPIRRAGRFYRDCKGGDLLAAV